MHNVIHYHMLRNTSHHKIQGGDYTTNTLHDMMQYAIYTSNIQ